ncbi:uncharacterized protein LY79DRAFT_9279 [Colletotrichum navitas]|uniref:Secreted protein n=1 Tax=Colletotrichum navitas TaxID=681940 RepID=A0AAD8QCS3_9PEZI|nr:uncharacterized protein LY79DRAFT_9279 [Colletotrichum navitas]KAK1600150.1 hypothetical protein LY79DRAFT_9279 [Colletotrichum navitas]
MRWKMWCMCACVRACLMRLAPRDIGPVCLSVCLSICLPAEDLFSSLVLHHGGAALGASRLCLCGRVWGGDEDLRPPLVSVPLRGSSIADGGDGEAQYCSGVEGWDGRVRKTAKREACRVGVCVCFSSTLAPEAPLTETIL